MAGLNTIRLSEESDQVLDRIRDMHDDRKMRNEEAIELALQKLKTYMQNDPKLKGK
jgi:hypothetical protein